MRACWMFMILLSCRLSHATTSQSTCNDLKVVCVPARDNVLVPCPGLHGEELTFNLLKDEEVICNHTCSHDKDASKCYQHTRVGVEVRENTENKSVSFMLTGVNASSSGLYRCEGRVMYPPPFIKACPLWILVRIEGHQCKLNKTDDRTKTGGDQKDGFLWIWILGLVLLGIYSLIVTIITVNIWVQWRRSESQSDYMNTKPRAPRDRKKRGVQIPIPRHF